MEDWTKSQVVMAVGAIINSALYLSFTAIAGLMLGYFIPMVLSIAAMGITFLGYAWYMQFGANRFTSGVMLASQIIGVLAGFSLIWNGVS